MMNDFTNTYLHCLNNNVDQHISDNLIALVFQPLKIINRYLFC